MAMSESFALTTGFIAIAFTLIGNLWFSHFDLPFKIGISITTVIWLVASSISVMNGVPA